MILVNLVRFVCPNTFPIYLKGSLVGLGVGGGEVSSQIPFRSQELLPFFLPPEITSCLSYALSALFFPFLKRVMS